MLFLVSRAHRAGGSREGGSGAGVTGLLVENCIVDASILKRSNFYRIWFRTVSGPGSLDMFLIVSGQVFKGTRWMPWHQEPKKDVGICDKPGGVDNRTLIPGCPNGETPPGAFRRDLATRI